MSQESVRDLLISDPSKGAAELVRQFGDRLYSCAFRLCGVHADAEDLVYRTFERVIAKIALFDGRSAFFTWMYSIMVNFWRMGARRKMANAIDFMPEHKRDKILSETMFIFIPLAHRLGLYEVKSEMENIWLKYKEPEDYAEISRKIDINVEKRKEEVDQFVTPIEMALKAKGYSFTIKRRVKTPYSIWFKMKNKGVPFEEIFDLYAVRIVYDPKSNNIEQERYIAYQIYNALKSLYSEQPARFRNWVNNPKSNGYESLHTTVMGPEGKWVEVQIRTERMDDIAERGFAAHWRYKGIKSESGLDEWLTGIREALENADDDRELMDRFKMDLYKDDVFVFTPKGDLYKLPHGATVLDFAFSIHTNLGCHCTGAKVNNRHVQLKYVLNNGDQVEILSSNAQTPKQGWLNIVTTSRARTKVRQALKEIEAKQASIGREEIVRRFKNRKIDLDEGTMLRLIRKMGYKQQEQSFYQQVADGKLTSEEVIEQYIALWNSEHGISTSSEGEAEAITGRSAADYRLDAATDGIGKAVDGGESNGILFVDPNMAGVEYKLAKCCNPIFGDDIFGFVTVSDGIKIHRKNCPNAPDLHNRFGYRVVPARWSGKSSGHFSPVTLSVVGIDDLGIVNNLTAIISKDEHMQLRSISIDTHDNLFAGTLTVMMDDTTRLNSLIRKLKEVKGVKQVERQ